MVLSFPARDKRVKKSMRKLTGVEGGWDPQEIGCYAALALPSAVHGLEAFEQRVLLQGTDVAGVFGPATWDSQADRVAVVVAPQAGSPAAERGETHKMGGAAEAEIHPDDPEKLEEHEAALALVPVEGATHVPVQKGPWTAKSTWKDLDGDGVGDVPGDDADVYIPKGIHVLMNAVQTARVRTIRVEGILRFHPFTNTELRVETLVVAPGGELRIGSERNPIAENVTAKVVILDNGPIDTDWDPHQLSRGIVSHGRVTVYGLEKTSFVALAVLPQAGATQLQLAEVPANWQVGDQILVTGTDAIRDRNDVLHILAIEGTTVTVDPLQYTYDAPPTGGSLYVANLSRNVVVTSENTEDVSRRGHVMFMHSPAVDVHGAGFYGVGRTDKRVRIDDPAFDDLGHLIGGTGSNARGRYPVHFHRSGAELTQEPAVITGSVVVDSPGWGFVNHDSYVRIEDNVSYDVLGAGFVAEDGNEIGTFKRNLAVRSRGSGEDLLDRTNIFDMGHSGHGFWFQGGGVEVEGNVAVGHHDAAFMFFTQHRGAAFEASNLADPALAGGRVKVPIGEVPIRGFKNNVAIASRSGLEIWQHLLNASHDGRSVVEDLLVWGVRDRAVNIPYSRGITLRRVSATGDLDHPAGVAIDRNFRTSDIRYEDVRLGGWEVGVLAPLNGDNVIQDGYFRNIDNIVIEPSSTQPRVIEIAGAIRLGALSEEALAGREQKKVVLRGGIDPLRGDVWRLFRPDTILLRTSPHFNQQLYFPEQAGEYVPFPAGTLASVPAEFIGKTNQQLWDQYGMALGGAVVPGDAVTDPKYDGLIGRRATYLPELKINSGRYTTRVDGSYRLIYRGDDGTRIMERETVDLREGWNALVRDVGGHLRTMLIFGDVTAPYFEPEDYTALVIRPNEISSGYTVGGYLYDDSSGVRYYRERFSGAELAALPVLEYGDGTQYLLLEFSVNDKAGNTGLVQLQLVID